jgi:hypothetical protein
MSPVSSVPEMVVPPIDRVPFNCIPIPSLRNVPSGLTKRSMVSVPPVKGTKPPPGSEGEL